MLKETPSNSSNPSNPCCQDSVNTTEKIQTAWKASIHGVFPGPYFLAFGLNTERYSVPLHIQPKCRKIPTRKSPVFGKSSRSNSFFFKEDIVAHYSMKIIPFFPVTVFSKHADIMLFTRFCIYMPEYLLTLIQKETFDAIWLDDCKKYHKADVRTETPMQVFSCEYCKFLNRRLL